MAPFLEKTAGLNPAETSQASVGAVHVLKVGVPQHLSDLGITEKDIPALADQALADVCTPGNPREVTLADIKSLYAKVL